MGAGLAVPARVNPVSVHRQAGALNQLQLAQIAPVRRFPQQLAETGSFTGLPSI